MAGEIARCVRERFNLLSETPDDRCDLPNDLGVDSVSESLRTERPVGIGIHDDKTLLESATSAKVGAIAF